MAPPDSSVDTTTDTAASTANVTAESAESAATQASGYARDIRRRGSWRYLFVFKRRPHLLGVPREWIPPDTSTPAGRQALDDQLDKNGFVSKSYLKQISEKLNQEPSRALESDLEELNEHLIPDFMQLDQEANHYQNLYYLYQWYFIIGALLTTVIAALGVLIYDSTREMPLLDMEWATLLPLITAILSGIVATVSFLNASQSPHEKWFKKRSQAESLRSLYYQYLARQGTFAVEDAVERIRRLDQRVFDVLDGHATLRDS